MTAIEPIPVVVLISGSGSNLQALINNAEIQGAPFKIAAVISNRPDVMGLQRAGAAGIDTHIIDHKGFSDRESFEQRLIQTIDVYQPSLLVLAGFMRILTNQFVHHYLGRLLNIHPSLLPRFPGLHTHQAALDAGDTNHGASVHFVTEVLDGGPVILQAEVPVLKGDTAEQLAARVLTKEHVIYPMVVNWFAEGRLQLVGNRVRLDERYLDAPVRLDDVEQILNQPKEAG